MQVKKKAKAAAKTKQVEFLKRRGIVLGTRNSDGRQAYLYMVNNLFAEIFYEKDNPRLGPERLVILHGLENLTRYLEKDLRKA